MQVLSSLSSIPFYAPSAGFAPTNSADVSAIASAYQVVSSTATQLYAGTAYVTSVNDAPISAGRAGNAANASMANSAYYDGTGRLISALPDEAAVSAIASAYADSAASGKLDKTAQVVTAIGTGWNSDDDEIVSAVNGCVLSADEARYAGAANSSNYARYDRRPNVTGYRDISSLPGSAEVSAIASAYAESAASSKVDISSNNNIQISAKGLIISGGTAITARYGNNMAVLQTSPIQRMYLSDLGSDKRVDIYKSGISGNDGGIWQYGTAEYGNLTSVYDTVSANSATWGAAGVDSATCSAIASAYAESAVSGKADSSALSSYALSADVSGTVDLVSTQSANWGGSALALSAGPGVKLEKSGNVLVASTDETLLWNNTEGKLTKDLTFPLALSETITNFKRVKFLYGGDSYMQNAHWIEFEATDNNPYTLYDFRCDGPSTTDIFWRLAKFNINGTAVTNTYNSTINLNTAFAGNGYNASGYNYLVQIVGINRTAEA